MESRQGTTLGADFLIEEAERHLKSGDLSGAAYSLLHVVRRNPNNNEAKLLLAKVFMSQGLPYKAEKLHEVWANAGAHPALPLQ